MPIPNLRERVDQAEKQAQQEGIAPKNTGFYKFKESDNVFRVMTIFEPIFEDFKQGICFTNCGFEGSMKQMCYIVDMRETDVDGRPEPTLKIFKMPNTIADIIINYQYDEDWKYDEVPMPYDIKVNAIGAGLKEVKYTVTPRPTRTTIDPKFIEQLEKATPITDLIKRMKEKNAAAHGKTLPGTESTEHLEQTAQAMPDYPEEEINPEDIPF